MLVRTTHGLAVALTGAALLVAAARPGHAGENKEEFQACVTQATDTNANLADREKALQNAMQGAHVTKGGAEILGKAIVQILKEMEKKKADPAAASFVQVAFRAIDQVGSFTAADLGTCAKPYLGKDVDQTMRLAALGAIEAHGASGVSAELLAIFSEGASKQHDSVEVHALNACLGLPGSDAEKMVKDVLKATKSKAVRMHAIGALGELPCKRPIGDLDADGAIKALSEFALATYPDGEVACAAAIAIFHWGSWDGIAQVIERAKNERRGPSRECYKAVCFVAHKLPAGFSNVSPENFPTSPQKSEATGAMYAWWDGAKGTKVDAGFWKALADAGFACKDTSASSKEAISVLISGLEAPNRALRYQCFDMLVRRLGPSEFSKEFKRLVTKMGKGGMAETEPPAGYPEGSAQSDQLYELQKERAKKWKAWWDANSGKATLVGGVWKVS